MSPRSDSRSGIARRGAAKHPPAKHPPGFVLVEVLVAVVVLSIGIVAVLGALRSGARIQDTAEKRLRAVYLLEETLALADAEGSLEAGEHTGAFEAPHEAFRWDMQVSPVDGPESPSGQLLLVEATVEWPSRPRARSVSASRYVWKPAVSE